MRRSYYFIDQAELVFDAWRMVVPKRLAATSDAELLRQLRAPD